MSFSGREGIMRSKELIETVRGINRIQAELREIRKYAMPSHKEGDRRK